MKAISLEDSLVIEEMIKKKAKWQEAFEKYRKSFPSGEELFLCKKEKRLFLAHSFGNDSL